MSACLSTVPPSILKLNRRFTVEGALITAGIAISYWRACVQPSPQDTRSRCPLLSRLRFLLRPGTAVLEVPSRVVSPKLSDRASDSLTVRSCSQIFFAIFLMALSTSLPPLDVQH